MEILTSEQAWSPLQKIAFRFSFIVLSLFVLLVNNGAYPFYYEVFGWLVELLHSFIPWIGKHILNLPYEITTFTNGSGDTTYDYVILFFILCIAVIGTLVWSLLDRNRKNYSTLYYWISVAVRFYVGLMLFNYGMYKVIKLQFPFPGVGRLMQPYGSSSPMGLAWTFLGFSKGYNMFMGLAEVAALMLLFRRTVTVGAIITLMTTANVMAVNYFYDVPVKIVSTGLVVMTLFLLIPDIKRLFKFFFTGEAVSLPVMPAPVIRKKWLRITGYSLKYLVIAYAVVFGCIELVSASKEYGDAAPKTPLYGAYTVNTFIVNQDTVPPLMTDSTYWRHLIIQWGEYAQIKFLNDSTRGYSMKIDTAAHTLFLKQRLDTTNKSQLVYQLDDKSMVLKGTVKDDSVTIYLNRKTDKDFRLMNRGFRWINEFPYNR